MIVATLAVQVLEDSHRTSPLIYVFSFQKPVIPFEMLVFFTTMNKE